jgi:hypothetical protein
MLISTRGFSGTNPVYASKLHDPLQVYRQPVKTPYKLFPKVGSSSAIC